MQSFLEFALRGLVDYPEAVSVTQVPHGKRTVYEVRVRACDVGKVIGKQGQTIAAIRSVANAAASRFGETLEIELVEDDLLREAAASSVGPVGDSE